MRNIDEHGKSRFFLGGEGAVRLMSQSALGRHTVVAVRCTTVYEKEAMASERGSSAR